MATNSDSSDENDLMILSLNRKQKLILTFKIFISWFCVVSICIHLYISIYYTGKLNGAVININHIINNIMCLIILYKQVNNLNENFILNLIINEKEKRVYIAKRIIKIHIVLVVAIHLSILTTYYSLKGFDDFSVLFYGIKLIDIVDNIIFRILLVTLSSIEILINLGVLVTFTIKYLTILLTFIIYIDQEYNYLNNSIQLGKQRFVDTNIFKQIEKSIYFYNSSVTKVNEKLNLIPFWLLSQIYLNFVSTITVISLSRGNVSIIFSLISIGINLIEMSIAALAITKLSVDVYNKMENYKKSIVSFIANSIKNMKKEINTNRSSLKFILINSPTEKLFVGNLYPLDYTLILSLFSSVITTTVMIVTTFKSLDFVQS